MSHSEKIFFRMLNSGTMGTVLIHQFFQKKGEAAILCADILLG